MPPPRRACTCFNGQTLTSFQYICRISMVQGGHIFFHAPRLSSECQQHSITNQSDCGSNREFAFEQVSQAPAIHKSNAQSERVTYLCLNNKSYRLQNFPCWSCIKSNAYLSNYLKSHLMIIKLKPLLKVSINQLTFIFRRFSILPRTPC
jgi:hypothetical protein